MADRSSASAIPAAQLADPRDSNAGPIAMTCGALVAIALVVAPIALLTDALGVALSMLMTILGTIVLAFCIQRITRIEHPSEGRRGDPQSALANPSIDEEGAVVSSHDIPLDNPAHREIDRRGPRGGGGLFPGPPRAGIAAH